MAREEVSIVIRAKDFASRVFKRVAGGLKRINISAQGLRRAFVAVIASAGGVVFVFKKIFDAGAGVFETQSKFNTVFGESAEQMNEFTEAFSRVAGLSRVAGKEIVATAGAIAQGMGLSHQASVDFSKAIIQLAGDLASFNNIPVEKAADAVTSAITGEREQLKRLGVIIRQVDIDQQAMVITGKTMVSQLNNAERAAATLQIITKRAGVAIGDLARTQDSAANTSKRIKAAFADQFDQLSTDLLPVLERLLPLFEELATKAGAATDRVAGFITTLFDLSGLTNATLRSALARFAETPEGQLQGVADRLRSEIAGKRTEIAVPEKFGDLGFFDLFRGMTEERKDLIEETDNLQIALGLLEIRIARLKDTSEGTADSVQRVVNAFGGGGPGVQVARGVVDTTGGTGRTTVGGVRLGSARGFEAARLKGFQEAAKLRVLENRARDASSEVETLAETVEDSFANMAIAAASGSAQMEQAITSAFQRILQSVGGGLFGGLLGGFGGLLLGKLLGGGRRDPVPVRIDDITDGALDKAQRLGPDRIVIQILDAQGRPIREIERDLRDLEARDGVERLPRGAFLGVV